MNKKNLIIISSICAFLGALFFALHQGWIIINTPSSMPILQTASTNAVVCPKKKVTLFYWQRETWHREDAQLVWTEYQAQNIAYLINSWLSLVDDEKITTKKITLQTAMLNPTGTELAVSFDHGLFSKDATTYEKWMLCEGLLKTVRENGIASQTVRFLIHHQPIIDAHLDFSNPWPIYGFIRN